MVSRGFFPPRVKMEEASTVTVGKLDSLNDRGRKYGEIRSGQVLFRLTPPPLSDFVFTSRGLPIKLICFVPGMEWGKQTQLESATSSWFQTSQDRS